MKIIEDMEQGSEKWLKWRRTKITGTDASCIMGLNPWETAIQRWEKKLGFTPESEVTPAMQRGMDLEPIAREYFNEKRGITFSPCIVEHESINWMAASLDGYHNGPIKSVLEIKCPGQADHQSALIGVVPKKYYPQLQHQLAVTGCDVLYYFSFDGKNGVTIEVPRYDEYIDKLIEAEKAFYKCLVTCTPPELSERDYISRDDRQWGLATLNWKMAKEDLDLAIKIEASMRKELIEVSQSRNSKGCGVKVQKIMRSGLIDYSKIQELEGVDLDSYRKPASESWRITLDE